MQLSGVFCLKPGEICILISWPLVPRSKIVTFLDFRFVEGLNFLLLSSRNKEVFYLVVVFEGAKTLEFLPGTCAQIFVV